MIDMYDSSDSDFTFGLTEERTLSDDELKQKVIVPSQKHKKISTASGKAQLYVTDDKGTLTYSDSGFAATKNGSVIAGRVHMTAAPQDIRFSGFWVMNEQLLTTLPSSTYTPIQTFTFSNPPYAKMISHFASILAGA